jgi:hypothetical protein
MHSSVLVDWSSLPAECSPPAFVSCSNMGQLQPLLMGRHAKVSSVSLLLLVSAVCCLLLPAAPSGVL